MKNIILAIISVILMACTEDTGMSPVYETIEVHDTVFVNNDVIHYDTISNTITVNDTVVLTKKLTDTVMVERKIIDTLITVKVVNDTVNMYDTVMVEKTVTDTVTTIKVISDTIVKTDTVVNTKVVYDTVIVRDTVKIHYSSSSETESSSSEDSSSSVFSSSSEVESSSSTEEDSSSSFDYEYDTFEMKGNIFTAFAWGIADAFENIMPADICGKFGFDNASISDIEALDKTEVFRIFENGNFKKAGINSGHTAVCSASDNKCVLKSYSGSHRIDVKTRQITSNVEQVKVTDLNQVFYPFYICKQ